MNGRSNAERNAEDKFYATAESDAESAIREREMADKAREVWSRFFQKREMTATEIQNHRAMWRGI